MRLSISSLFCYTFIGALIAYYGKGVIYPETSIISAAAFIILLTISARYFIPLIFRPYDLPLFLRIWSILLISNICLLILTGDLSNELHFSFFGGTLINMLSVYPIYKLTKKAIFNEFDLKILLFVLTPLTILDFFSLSISDIFSLNITKLFINDTNNISYHMAGLMPLIFFIKHRLIAILSAAFFLIIIFLSLKRGAVLVGAFIFASLILRIIFEKNIRNSRLSKFGLPAVCICIIAALYIIYTSNEALVNRFELVASEGDTSLRDVIWLNILTAWLNEGGLTNQLFGYGYAGSIRLSGSHFAHNDWIELLASLGFFGVLIYILLFIFAFRAITSINNAGRDRWLWLTIISSWFLITIFSMWYSSLYYAPTSIILAFILGRNHVFSHKRMKSHK